MKRLLYLEDNHAMQKVVARHLEGLAEIQSAETLSEGRSLLLGGKFDLMLADVHLPDGNSLDLVWELRRRHSAEQLPIILLSASMDRTLAVRSLQAGANDCYAMPMHMTVLVAAVARMLDRAYVRPNDLGGVVVTWIEGTSGGRFWVYCPELNLRLDGEDPEAVGEAMLQRVQKSVADGAGLPFVGGVKLAERLVDLSPPAGANGHPGAAVEAGGR
jgi:DNA-binding response OmpR family regulator